MAVARLDPEWQCGCGRFKTDWPAAKGRHQMHCDGTKVQLSGRIALRQPETAPRAAVAPVAVVRQPAVERMRRNAPSNAPAKADKPARRAIVRVPRRAVAVVVASPMLSARVTFLDQLRGARAKIDDAIAAVEALA